MTKPLGTEDIEDILCRDNKIEKLSNNNLRENIRARKTTLRRALRNIVNQILGAKEDERTRKAERRTRAVQGEGSQRHGNKAEEVYDH